MRSVDRRRRRRAAVRRLRRADVALALVSLAALATVLGGCETTAEKSAKLERAAKRQERATQTGLTIARASTVVKVLEKSFVQSSQGTAIVVTVRNDSAHALAEVPVAVALKDAHGATVYSNATPGLAKTLTSIALLPAHARLTWIDDQAQGAGASTVSAEVGEGKAVAGALPSIGVHEAQLGEGSAEGTVANDSTTDQSELVVYAIARRGARVVAAGRAVLASLAAHQSAPFQAFLIGEAKGATLQVSAPPTTSG